nr:MAG TPA: hypothetical protein [Caudoviricetes sp.]
MILFSICTIINVILSTVKSLITIKGSKLAAALINALTYGFYTYVILLTSDAALSIEGKMAVTAAANFIGVYLVKLLEEKARKEMLWKIESTIKHDEKILYALRDQLELADIPFNWIDINKYFIINCFCATQGQSAKAKTILDAVGAKYFVSETKNL